MTDNVRVTMTHIRSLKLCARGVRDWYAAHGLDYNELVMEGTPVEVLMAVDDSYATKACDVALAEARGVEL